MLVSCRNTNKQILTDSSFLYNSVLIFKGTVFAVITLSNWSNWNSRIFFKTFPPHVINIISYLLTYCTYLIQGCGMDHGGRIRYRRSPVGVKSLSKETFGWPWLQTLRSCYGGWLQLQVINHHAYSVDKESYVTYLPMLWPCDNRFAFSLVGHFCATNFKKWYSEFWSFIHWRLECGSVLKLI